MIFNIFSLYLLISFCVFINIKFYKYYINIYKKKKKILIIILTLLKLYIICIIEK